MSTITYSSSVKFTPAANDFDLGIGTTFTPTYIDSNGVISTLPGTWKCYRSVVYEGVDHKRYYFYTYRVTTSRVPVSLLISEGSLEVTCRKHRWREAVELIKSQRIEAGRVPTQFQDKAILSSKPHTLTLKLEVSSSGAGASSSSSPPSRLPIDSLPGSAKAFARTCQEFAKHQLPFDVKFVFPLAHQELWARSGVLAAASPYFKMLLASGFLEGIASKEGQPMGEREDRPIERTFVDSDDESDAALPFPPTTTTTNSYNLPFHEIIIREASYTTYSAVLVWIQSRYIEFAPLSSTFKSPQDRQANLSSSNGDDPSYPYSPSPKSVYRLAHFLGLEELQSLALKSIESQLTIENAAFELMSDVSRLYEKVQKVVLDFVVENWEKVKVSKGIVELEKRVEAGEVEGAVDVLGIFMNLAKRLGKV